MNNKISPENVENSTFELKNSEFDSKYDKSADNDPKGV